MTLELPEGCPVHLPGTIDNTMPVRVNAGEDAVQRNFAHARTLDRPWLPLVEPHGRVACLVAGGPSAADHLDRIKTLAKDKDADIFAMNGTIKWLNRHGITPDQAVMLDARPENTVFVKGAKARRYLISAQCDRSMFDAVPAKKTTVWWPAYEGVMKHTRDKFAVFVGGGTTVGLQALSIAYILGYREIHLFGYDSSYKGEAHHAYDQPIPAEFSAGRFSIRGRDFRAEPWMVRQATEFQPVLKQLTEAGVHVFAHGDGLLQEVFKELMPVGPDDALTAVYDLATSPPTWNFLDFLLYAEKVRLQRGFQHMDVVFQPGPNHGFRADNLPPGPEQREMMLWRICVAACRCLPSVRNVTVLQQRQAVHGAVLPLSWTVDYPTACYGFNLIAQGVPMALRGRYGNPFPGEKYVTLTIREAPYWPERNSSREVWAVLARRLFRRGYKVVVVPDAFNPWDDQWFAGGWEDITFFPAAALDLDIRVSLYQHAACNLLHANGVVEAARLSGAPHLVFCPLNEDSMATSTEFFARVGVDVSTRPQFAYNGRVEWDCPETVEDMLAAFDDWTTATFQKGNSDAEQPSAAEPGAADQCALLRPHLAEPTRIEESRPADL